MSARRNVMEFERPLVELEEKLEELKAIDVADSPELTAEIRQLEADIDNLRVETYTDLSAWQRVQIARHPDRPKTQDFVEALFTEVVELRGDRAYGDDKAVFAGLGTIGGRRVALVGHRKGANTKENVERNFGSPHPEGFRKAMRVMRLADKFGLPIVTFLDTAGAHPGIGAEERGQAWAIAESLALLSGVRVPVIAIGIGEGGSGGALAIGFGDRLIMLENAYYSVSSPEACASIIFKDAGRAEEAAGCLRLTADDLVELGIADEIVPEPLGGAHRDPSVVFGLVREALLGALDALGAVGASELVKRRYERLRAVGVFAER